MEKNRKIVFDSDSSEEEAPCTQNKPDQNDSKVTEKVMRTNNLQLTGALHR